MMGSSFFDWSLTKINMLLYFAILEILRAELDEVYIEEVVQKFVLYNFDTRSLCQFCLKNGLNLNHSN